MKNLLIAILALTLFSCSQDAINSVEETESFNFTVKADFDQTVAGVYKGTFTTMDSQERGIVTVQINKAGNARALVQLASGFTHELKTDRVLAEGIDVTNLIFSDNELSFRFTVGSNGNDPSITKVSLKNKEAVIAILKETSRGPLLPITGTYSCTSCEGHPLLGNGFTQTFNAITVSGSGDNAQNIVTTIILNGKDFGSTTGNTQSNCANSGADRQCDIEGASATITGVRSIIWTGTHKFKRGGSVDCSEVNGTWTFASSYGPMSGTFVGDARCGF